MTLSPLHQRVLKDRGISNQTAQNLSVYSGVRAHTGNVTPHESGAVLVFPYYKDGEIVAEKYREPNKKFSQRANPYKTFFNAKALQSPELMSGDKPLVICEGEFDCLAAIESGYAYTVSVPDGAPPARDSSGKLIDVPEGTEGIEIEHDEKYRYIYNNWDALTPIKRIIIATDSDEPGQRLAAELVRRLGRVRCSYVTWPIDCKDFNDVLVKRGKDYVLSLINDAKPYPVSGVYTFFDLPEEEEIVTVSTGWARLDDYLKVYRPAFMVVTGRAGHGKTTWTQQMVAQIAENTGWNVAVASFEMRIKPFVSNALGTAYLGRPPMDWDNPDKMDVNGWLNDHFCFIAGEPDDTEQHDIDWLIRKATAAVIRHGVKVLLIDPWNEIEHNRHRDETTTEYTNRAVMALKSFARQYDVLVIVVAHPTKSGAAKDPQDMTLYDISDSAAFQNKADLGVVVSRLGDPEESTRTAIFIRKVRYQPEAGLLGHVELEYDKRSRLFF